MAIAALPAVPHRHARWVAIVVLTVTQVIGWSTTFHIPAVLSARIAAGTGLRPDLVYGGLTVMLVVAALLAPAAGRLLERYGARPLMVGGSVLLAAGLVLVAVSQGPASFALAWIVIGVAMPFTLNQASSTALVQISPAHARQAIALLLMLSGLSAVFAWPALLAIEGALGWRGTVLVCAALNLVVCAPLHLVGLPRRRVVPGPASAKGGDPAPDYPPVPGAFPLAAVTFSITGMLTWGLPLHMINLLRDFGHGEATAVALGALFAPAQVFARAVEMLGGRRLPILLLGLVSTILMPLAILLLVLFGHAPAGAAAFAVGYGIAAGISSIVRAVAPLRLFGAAAYATMLGRLSLPMNFCFALAPIGFSSLRETFGGEALAVTALGLSLLCVPPMAILFWRTRGDAVRA